MMNAPSVASAEPCIPEEQIVSSQDLATQNYITGERFNEDIYRLKVGVREHIFMVHRRVLEKSPVFARMTAGGFSESISKEIVLLDDHEDVFGRVLEHLYGNRDTAFDFDAYRPSLTVLRLTGMYVMADKYQLPVIQEDVVKELSEMQIMKDMAIFFFHTMSGFFRNFPNPDQTFRAYFIRQATEHLRSLTEIEANTLLKICAWEDSFAKAMFEAQLNLYREDQLKWSEERKSMAAKLEAIKPRPHIEW